MTVSLSFSEKFDRIVMGVMPATGTTKRAATGANRSKKTHGICSLCCSQHQSHRGSCSKPARTCDERCRHDGNRDCNKDVSALCRTARCYYLRIAGQPVKIEGYGDEMPMTSARSIRQGRGCDCKFVI